MPSTTIFRRTLLISCLLLLAPSSRVLAQAPSSYNVIYTGSLYGYFRYPEVQVLEPGGCPAFNPDDLGDPERAFESVLNKAAESAHSDPVVRVATGDNFGPYLLARQAWNQDSNRLVPKDEYEYLPHTPSSGKSAWPWVRVTDSHTDTKSTDTLNLNHGESDVPMDNVGCFIRLMHFDAIVPGKFDFYFGPERLRQLARFLKSPPKDGPDKELFMPVRMLAVNLSLNTRYVDPTSPTQSPDNSGGGPSQALPGANGGPVPTASLPKVVLPWLRSVTIKDALVATAKMNPTSGNEPNAVTLIKEARFDDKQKSIFWDCMKNLNANSTCPSIVGMVPGRVNFRITANSKLDPDKDVHYEFTFAANLAAVCIDPSPVHPSKEDIKCGGAWAQLRPQAQDETKRPTPDLDYALAPGQFLQPNTSCTQRLQPDGTCPHIRKSDNTYQLKIEGKNSKSIPPQKFSVQLPYLEDSLNFYKQSGNPSGNLSYKLPWVPNDKPWVCAAKEHIAIFGVVDPSIGEFIGRLNDTWFSVRTKGTQFDPVVNEETDLQVSDPAEALQQALQYFDESSDCTHARKILLAQMTQSQAYDLAARVSTGSSGSPFDLVIAQADPDRASGDGEVKRYSKTGPYDGAQPPQENFGSSQVLVPGFHYGSQDPYGLTVRLQVAKVERQTTGGKRERTVENNAVPNTSLCSSAKPCNVDPMNNKDLQKKLTADPNTRQSLEEIIKPRTRPHTITYAALQLPQTVAPAGDRQPDPRDWTYAQWATFFEHFGLEVMRETCHADVAFLQHRDVFFPSSYTEPVDPTGEFYRKYDGRGIQALLDIVFWKGDFIQCMNLPGSTISSLLQTSKQFQNQDDLGVTTELSRNWALASLGVTGQDPQSQLINGQNLDPKKLYSVAITDFLANGDTGYPALQGAEPYPAADWYKIPVHVLSYSLFASLLPTVKPPTEPRPEQILDTLLRDTSPVRQKAPEPGVTAWFQGLVPIGKQTKISPFDATARDVTRWSLNLYQLDGSYSLFAHRDKLAEVGQNFPGINQVDLSSPDSLSFAFDHLARLQWDHPSWLLFAQSELNYGAHNQRGKPPNEAYQPSQTADYYSPQVGFGYRLLPHFLNPSSVTFQVPLELDTQVLRALTQYNIPCPANETCMKSTATAAPVYVDRSHFYSVRPGFRYAFSFLRPQQPGQGQGGGQSGGQSGGQAGGQSGQGGGGGGAGQGGAKGQGQGSTLDSYLEFGFADGQLRNGPNAFTFSYTGTPAGGATLPNPQTCYVANLASCTGQLVGPTIASQLIKVGSGRDHLQQGLYLNFRIDIPLWHSTEFTLQSLGNFYFNRSGDAFVDTRYYDDLKGSFTVPIFRKISLAPTYEVVWFKNKVLSNTYVSQSAYVSLNYSFGWHSGLNWLKVLEGYSDPVPTLTPIPTR
jgi:hypothetical protein